MTTPLSLTQWLGAGRPDATLVAWHDTRNLTLGDLRADVSRIVPQLHAHPAQRWALCLEDGYLLLVGLLATLYAGKIPLLPGHARPALLEEQRELFDAVLSAHPLAISLPSLQIEHRSEPAPPLPAFSQTDPVIEFLTSGSTGKPRRVVKPLRCLDAEAALLAHHYGEHLAGSRVVASVPPMHLYGLTFRLFLPMSLGVPCNAALIQYPEQLACLANDCSYTFISSPAFLKRLDPALNPPPLALIISAGGPLAPEAAAQTADWCAVWPQEIYGSTETGVLAWRQCQPEPEAWHPFPTVTFTAEGPAWRAHSPLIAETNGLLLDDRLALEPGGDFQLLGRRGREVKIEEKRIALPDIETRLLALPGIREAVALPVMRRGRQSIGALLVLDAVSHARWQQSPGAVERSWRQALRPWLDAVALPRHWRVVNEIPVNSMNKRVYADLQELFSESR